MAEEILISYRVEVDQLKAELKQVQAQLKATEATGKEAANKTSKEFNKAGSDIKQTLSSIAGAIGLAFGTAQVISFGKESIKAFAEAEVNANKLKFAVTQIGKEGQAAYQKLIDQSNKLQDISIFSDDDIQKAQTQLATLGLNSRQIEELIPKVLDLASATGQELGSATDTIIQGINGQTRGLRAVGLEFEATGDKTKNLAILTENLGKFQGSTAAALETTAGKARRLENVFDNLKETIGELIVNQGNDLLDFLDLFSKGFDETIGKRATNQLVSNLSQANSQILKDASKSEEARIKAIKQSEARIIELKKASSKAQNLNQINYLSTVLQNELTLQREIAKINQEGAGLKATVDKGLAAKEFELAKKNALELRDLKASLIEDEKSKELAQLINKFTDLNEAHKGQKDYLLSLETAYQNERNAIIKKYADQEKALEDKSILDSQNAIKIKGDKILEEARKVNKALADEDKKADEEQLQREKEKEDAIKTLQSSGFQFATDLLNSYNQIQQNNIESQIQLVGEQKDAEIAALDEQLSRGLISRQDYEKKKQTIDDRARERERQLKREAFEAQKQAAIISTLINTATAIVAQLANPTPYVGFVLAALAAASGAAQLAVIESQPTPKFAKGVVDLKGKGTKTSDSISARLSVGESVITADATATDKALFEAFNKGKGKKYIYEMYVAPALKEQLSNFNNKKDQSFASNIAQSMLLNNGNFKDGNILESLKMNRKADKENIKYLAKVISQNNYNPRSW